MQGNHSQAGGRPSPTQLASLTLRSFGQLYDMNLAATRVMLQTQARAASVFGWPDWSDVLHHVDERARNVLASSAEQIAQNAQRANEAAAELQRQVGRVVETQAQTVADTVQRGLEELGTQTSEGLKQLCDTARAQAEEAERVAQTLSQEMRDTLRQGSEHWRDAVRQGTQQFGEAARQGGEQLSSTAHQAGSEARDAMQGNGSHAPQAGEQPSGDDKSGRRGGKGGQQPNA